MPYGNGARRALVTAGAVAASLAVTPALANADVWGTQFESPSYSAGDINGQADWMKTGPFDANVVNLSSYPNAAGYGFGSKALQISNFTTSGSFGDQTFTPSVTDEAGEASADSGGLAGGVRQTQFKARFRIGVADPTDVPGASEDRHVTVSADRGDGSRMSYLRFEDQADGIHVFFDDTPSTAVDGSGHVNFDETDIATLSRGQSHLVETSIDFVDGASNDVVKVSIDGNVVKTGTTWENYYRVDSEQAPAGNKVPTVDSLLLREGGSSNAGQQGKGFLIDDVRIESTSPGAGVGPAGPAGAAGPGGPAGPSTPASQAQPNPVTVASTSLKADKKGRIAVRLSCPQGAGLCDGRLVLTAGSKRLGRSDFTIAGGRAQTVRIKLSRSALSRLARSTRVKASVFSRDAKGTAAQTAKTLTLTKR
jgi:hypothetical protein